MTTASGYRALAAQLRADISAGVFPPPTRLPTEAELVERCNVSRQTVRQAFSELVAEGLVYRVRGRGTFAVASPGQSSYVRSVTATVDDLLAPVSDAEMKIFSPLTRIIDVAVADRLRLSSPDVYACEVRHLRDGEAFLFTHTYVPPALGRQIAGDPRIATEGARVSTTIASLIDAVHVAPVAGARESVRPGLADETAVEILGCELGAPVLLIDRLYFDADGKPVELAVSVSDPRRYSYRVEMRRRLG